jgi:hypothetical protein
MLSHIIWKYLKLSIDVESGTRAIKNQKLPQKYVLAIEYRKIKLWKFRPFKIKRNSPCDRHDGRLDVGIDDDNGFETCSPRLPILQGRLILSEETFR